MIELIDNQWILERYYGGMTIKSIIKHYQKKESISASKANEIVYQVIYDDVLAKSKNYSNCTK